MEVIAKQIAAEGGLKSYTLQVVISQVNTSAVLTLSSLVKLSVCLLTLSCELKERLHVDFRLSFLKAHSKVECIIFDILAYTLTAFK